MKDKLSIDAYNKCFDEMAELNTEICRLQKKEDNLKEKIKDKIDALNVDQKRYGCSGGEAITHWSQGSIDTLRWVLKQIEGKEDEK